MTSGAVSSSIARGFTLVEILVALSAGILMIALLSQALLSVRDGWRSMRADLRIAQTEQAAVTILNTSLSQALPPDPADPRLSFQGAPHEVTFVVASSEPEGNGGLVSARVFVERSADGKMTLTMAIEPFLATTQVRHRDDRRPLLTGLHSVRITYNSKEGGVVHSSDTWRAGSKLPDVVRIDLVYPQPSNRRTSLNIAPRLNTSGRCLFDPVSYGCRV